MAFTRADSQAGAAATHEIVRQRRALERRINVAAYRIASREDIPATMLEIMDEAARKLMDGTGLPPVETALDALRYVELMAKVQTIARLETGESTSNALMLSVDMPALMDRLNNLAQSEQGAIDVTSSEPISPPSSAGDVVVEP